MKFFHRLNQLLFDVAAKGFFHLLSANVLIQLVAFASQLFVAGILSPEDVGRIKIITTFLSVFSIIGGMGLNASTLKLCSENRSEAETKELFGSGVVFTVVSTVVFYVLALVLNSLGFLSSDTIIRRLMPMGLFPLITNSAFMVLVSYFQATKQIRILSRITVANKLIAIVAIILLTWWFGINGYYVAYNLSFIVMFFVGFRLLRKDFAFSKNRESVKRNFKTHLIYAKPSLLSNLLSEISAYADIFVINYLLKDMKEIGYYSFALTLTVALRVFPFTVQQMAAPYFSGLSSDRNHFVQVFKKYNRQLYLVVGVSLLLAVLAGPFLIRIIFAGKYDSSIPFFVLLSVGWSIRLLNQLQSAAIFGLGKIRYNAWSSFISLIFNIFIYVLFVHWYGAIGAAWASIPAGIVMTLTSALFLRKAIRE
ncbi:MAG: oligosaccharide flippase family protein [Paludibacteraceae bacterium]|nr:oligosaccharide flippase family protein [Paludibacteraceae bacterium]